MRFIVGFAVVAAAALVACIEHTRSTPDPLSCFRGSGAPGENCACDVGDTCVAAREQCDTDYGLYCYEGATCSGDCGTALIYCRGATCELGCGPSCDVHCVSNSKCDLTLGDASHVECLEGATCNITCAGKCTMTCEASATCALTCGSNAPQSLSGTGGC